MIVLGLAGKARSGKDSVADYLVRRYGFMKFSFTDALYGEVSQAFLVTPEFLRDAATKDTLSSMMALNNCSDAAFVKVAKEKLLNTPSLAGPPDGEIEDIPLTPRWVLQVWGTEYRRGQDPDYWVKKAQEFLAGVAGMFPFPEQRPQYFVNTSVRFANERDWLHETGGNVWHIRRDSVAGAGSHVSEDELPVLEYEREIYNNDTLERLGTGIEMLLSSSAKFVRVEPMERSAPVEAATIAQLRAETTAKHAEHSTFVDLGCDRCMQDVANDAPVAAEVAQ